MKLFKKRIDKLGVIMAKGIIEYLQDTNDYDGDKDYVIRCAKKWCRNKETMIDKVKKFLCLN